MLGPRFHLTLQKIISVFKGFFKFAGYSPCVTAPRNDQNGQSTAPLWHRKRWGAQVQPTLNDDWALPLCHIVGRIALIVIPQAARCSKAAQQGFCTRWGGAGTPGSEVTFGLRLRPDASGNGCSNE